MNSRATAALRTVKSTSGTGLGIPVSWNIAARYRSSRSGERQSRSSCLIGCRGREVLVTGQTAALAPDLEGVMYESRGRTSLRNASEPIELFAVLRNGASQESLLVDPVCRMAVDPERASGQLRYDDTAYFFCSLTCAATFAQNPERFTGS
jgi:YHS domain-containing protein